MKLYSIFNIMLRRRRVCAMEFCFYEFLSHAHITEKGVYSPHKRIICGIFVEICQFSDII